MERQTWRLKQLFRYNEYVVVDLDEILIEDSFSSGSRGLFEPVDSKKDNRIILLQGFPNFQSIKKGKSTLLMV